MGVVANELDCDFLVSEFELLLFYYLHFWTNTCWKGMNLIISPGMDKIVPRQFFYKDAFGIR